eukprot:gene5982-8238_t
MAQILQPYRVPIVYDDLTEEETLQDVFYALDNLSGTIKDVFNKIDKRITEEKNRVNHINNRVSVCKSKVDKVKGSNQAITVFSTSKFPAPKELPSYPTLFSQMNEMPSPYRDVVDDVIYLPATANKSILINRELQSEVQDIMLRINTYNTDLERVEFIMEDQGIGPIPRSTMTVGSLLLFNSNINLYKEYQTQDNLVSAGRQKSVEDEVTKGLGSAPSTMLSGDALPDIQALDLTFKPSMGEMSSLALPTNLPLDFLANIQFSGVDLPSIAPSSHAKANYSLPQITDGGLSYAPTTKQPKQTSAPPLPPSSNTNANNAPPPPPPPPPPSTNISTSNNNPQQQTSAPPPPPPPKPMPPPPPVNSNMPLPPSSTINNNQEEEEPEEDNNASSGSAPRNNLLDAIKGMSVSKLRSKEESAMAAAKVQKKVEQAKPLTMAEALKERLQRRNNALSGKDDNDQKRRDSLVVQAARNQQLQDNDVKAPSSLLKLGFASMNEGNNKRPPPPPKPSADDDSDEEDYKPRKSTNPSFKPSFKIEDSDSDTSAMSDVSGPVTNKPLILSPPKPLSVPSTIPPPIPPQGASSGGLLNAANPTLANMLSKAKKLAGSDSDNSGEDDWD